MANKRTEGSGTPRARRPQFPQSERELIVIAKPEVALRATATGLASISGAKVDKLEGLLKGRKASIRPLFGREERIQRDMGAVLAAAPTISLPEMSTFYRVEARDSVLDDLAAELREEEIVQTAYVKPPSAPPIRTDDIAPVSQVAPPIVTPDFTSRQGYLDQAPDGIDARYAWAVPGGKGQGVGIIDIEGAWRFTHEDLLQNQGGVIGGTQYTSLGWRNHGTAVVGEIGADENTFGVTGICPEANVRAIAIGNLGSAAAIRLAAQSLNPGDIILIELHRAGPRHSFQARNDQLGYIAVEWWPDDFAAIVFATGLGVIVVEAAGNGAEDLDDTLYNSRPVGFPATWQNPFDPSNPQSGATLVGAGAPPPGTHGRNHGADRSRLGFSNYGSRVDAQGWGREVTTTGYGDLQNGPDEDEWYKDTFSGTSSASPIVVGALGCMQGALNAANQTPLNPATATNILRSTGSPQQNEPGRPATQRIGNRPDLRQAFQQLGLERKLMEKRFKERKEIIKEIKEKDFREKSKEFKEWKEHKEYKEKDRKEIKEKDIYEGYRDRRRFEDMRRYRPDVPQPEALPAAHNVDERLTQLEGTVAEIAHFIEAGLRPDMQTSALSQESDLMEMSRHLEKQATDAKELKDNKDIEKPRET